MDTGVGICLRAHFNQETAVHFIAGKTAGEQLIPDGCQFVNVCFRPVYGIQQFVVTVQEEKKLTVFRCTDTIDSLFALAIDDASVMVDHIGQEMVNDPCSIQSAAKKTGGTDEPDIIWGKVIIVIIGIKTVAVVGVVTGEGLCCSKKGSVEQVLKFFLRNFQLCSFFTKTNPEQDRFFQSFGEECFIDGLQLIAQAGEQVVCCAVEVRLCKRIAFGTDPDSRCLIRLERFNKVEQFQNLGTVGKYIEKERVLVGKQLLKRQMPAQFVIKPCGREERGSGIDPAFSLRKDITIGIYDNTSPTGDTA